MFVFVPLASSGFRTEASGLKIPPPSLPTSSVRDDRLHAHKKRALKPKQRYGIRTFHLSWKRTKNRPVTPEEIRELRKTLSCTAKELAAALEIDQATMLAWEKGELFPTKQFVDRMRAFETKGPSSIPRLAKGKANVSPMT